MAAENGEPEPGTEPPPTAKTAAAKHAAGTARPAAPTPDAECTHSRAFENLVSGSDDIVGLLAYAKFKQSVHEGAMAGTVMDRAARNITPAMVGVLRSAAEQLIGQVVDDGIQAAAPDIEKSALKTEMEAQFTDVTATIRSERGVVTNHIDQRTSFLNTFLTNLAAWVVTLIIAVVIVYLFNRPSPEQSLLGVAGKRTETAQQMTTKVQPQLPAPAGSNVQQALPAPTVNRSDQ